MVAVEEAENPIFAEVKHHPSGKWGGWICFHLSNWILGCKVAVLWMKACVMGRQGVVRRSGSPVSNCAPASAKTQGQGKETWGVIIKKFLQRFLTTI